MNLLSILLFTLALFAACFPGLAIALGQTADINTLLDMKLEELLVMEVTSVSKKKQKLNESAAAIYVITADDINRSGVTSIPEALSLAPGIQVAKIQSNKWAISSRGFNAEFSNKLLVLIDGRSVYTPSFSGVYWEDQDTVLADIDRIEVIRGPGATLWGANAVNGVVNIITKTAGQTLGALAEVIAGNEEKAIVQLRYGGQLSEDVAARVYGKFTDRDASYSPDLNRSVNDDWQTYRAGFRVDGAMTQSNWRVQGDIYSNKLKQIASTHRPASNHGPAYVDFSGEWTLADIPPLERNVAEKVQSKGHNVLGFWEKQINTDSLLSFQAYIDRKEREELRLGQEITTFDLDLQHVYSGFENHGVIWGLGCRRIDDDFRSTIGITIDRPASQTNELLSAFLQDDMVFFDKRLRFTLGTKLEHNRYTGIEVQPSAKLTWLPNLGITLWSSVSRAVRTPSAIERRGSITVSIVPLEPPVRLAYLADDTFESEDLLAWELGFRFQPTESTAVDLALFLHQYDNVASYETVAELELANPFGPPVILPLTVRFKNELEVDTHGAELVFDWHVASGWRMQANYSFIDITAQNKFGSNDPRSAILAEGATPAHQVSLRSLHDLSENLALDFWIYYTDELAATTYVQTEDDSVDDYTSFNMSLRWQPIKDVELALVGQNLLDSRHNEFNGDFNPRTEVERSVFVRLTARF